MSAEERIRTFGHRKGKKLSAEFCEGNRQRQKAKFRDPQFRERWAAAQAAGIERRKLERAATVAMVETQL